MQNQKNRCWYPLRRSKACMSWLPMGLVSLLLLTGSGCYSRMPLEPSSADYTASALTLRAGVRVKVTVSAGKTVQLLAENNRVSAEGMLSLPLVGDVNVQGLSLRDAEKRLAERYSEFYVDASVKAEFVFDAQDAIAPWGYITVLGRVKNPGRVNLPPTQDMTVTRAIQLAGGLDASAAQGSVRVTRSTPQGRQERKVNLNKIGQGARDQDLLLEAGDVVYVPELFF